MRTRRQASLAFSAFGLVFASIPIRSVGNIMMPSTLIRWPLLFISGIFVPLEEMAGWPGLIAGGAFIVPAFLISLTLSVAYVRFGSLPQATALFYGINPAVMAIILAATYHLGRTALRDKPAIALGVASLAAALLGVNEVVILLDAIAVGQMTPGPVLSSATFIGYLVAGLPGAAVSTVAVFLPAFFIVALVGPWIPRLRQSPVAQAFLRGVNAAVVALIPSTGSGRRLAVSLALFRSAIVDVWTALIMLAGLAALLRWRVDTFWLVIGGAGAGLVHWLVV